MKRTIYLFVIGFLLTNCTHRIKRVGYDAKKDYYQFCDVVINNNILINDSIFVKVGSITLGESGFSTRCNESDAIRILRGEACTVNADLIVITDEKRPDVVSSCYRCKADFYQFKSEDLAYTIKDDQQYEIQNTQSRVQKDRSTNATIIAAGFAIGFIIGLLMFQ